MVGEFALIEALKTTGAHIRYGLAAGNSDSSNLVLDITTSNAFIDGKKSDAQGTNGFSTTKTDSVGNQNQVDVDFFVSNC
jgi:hypothetical protein